MSVLVVNTHSSSFCVSEHMAAATLGAGGEKGEKGRKWERRGPRTQTLGTRWIQSQCYTVLEYRFATRVLLSWAVRKQACFPSPGREERAGKTLAFLWWLHWLIANYTWSPTYGTVQWWFDFRVQSEYLFSKIIIWIFVLLSGLGIRSVNLSPNLVQ